MANYTSPTWVNDSAPKLNAENLQALTDCVEKNQLLHGSGAPTTSLDGVVGQSYRDDDTGLVYQCLYDSGSTFWGNTPNIEELIKSPVASGITLVSGGILYGTGGNWSTNTRVRMDFANVAPGEVYLYKLNSQTYEFSTQWTYSGLTHTSGIRQIFAVDAHTIILPAQNGEKYFRTSFAYAEDHSHVMTDEDMEAISSALTVTKFVDDTLSVAGAAADAKAAGDAAFSAYPHDIVSGPAVVFHDGADGVPVRDFTISIIPHQSGSGDPSSSNIRQINGRTSLVTHWAHKNMLAYTATYAPGSTATSGGITRTVLDDTSVRFTGTYTGTSTSQFLYYIMRSDFVLGPGNYVLSGCPSGGGSTTYNIRMSSGGSTASDPQIAMDSGNGASFTIQDYYADIYVVIRLRVSWLRAQTEPIDVLFKPMIRLAGESSTFEPSISSTQETNTISLPTEAGTVYGAICDLTTGVLSVDTAEIDSYNGETLPGRWISDRDVYVAGTTPTIGAQVVYWLDEPVTYQGTPTRYSSYLGTNTVWGYYGESTVDYRADPNLYIQRLTGSTEDDMIANANIDSGKYFMVGNTLYLSTAAIAQGETIVPGTNCTLTNLAEALNTLNAQ